ncbi:MAG: hypothetical protein HC806_10630 [Anaerolineae bacterium]|nr:hypothetical protein [Anaerolineae bacterium]
MGKLKTGCQNPSDRGDDTHMEKGAPGEMRSEWRKPRTVRNSSNKMITSKRIRAELLKKIAQPTIYKRMESVRETTGKSISKEVAVDVVASQEGIDVYSILKDEGRIEELAEFKDARAKFDFDNGNDKVKRITKNDLVGKNDNYDDRSPYDYTLSKFNIDEELVADSFHSNTN